MNRIQHRSGCRIRCRRCLPLAEVEVAQLWVHFFVVRDGWEAAVMETMNHARIFDADAHRMPSEALGVGNQDLVRAFAKGRSERFDLRLSRTTACGV